MSDPTGAQKRAARLMRKASNHGGLFVLIGQIWAFPTLLALSVGAFIKLAGDGLLPPEVNAAGRIAATIILLISGVLALEIALYRIGDNIARGVGLGSSAWDIVLLTVIAPLEVWTFYLLLTNQPANGPTDLMRAAEAIMAAAYLGTLSKRPPTDRDFVRIIGNAAGERTYAKLEATPMDQVGMGRLYRIQALANDESLSYAERSSQLVAAMEELAPGSVERESARLLEEMRARVEEAEGRADDLETQAREQTGRLLVQTLLVLASGGTIPEWMQEAWPELASLDFAQLAGGRKRSAAGPLIEAAPRTLADRQRKWLGEVLRAKGIVTLTKTPKGRQGVWVSAAEIVAITGNTLDKVAAGDLIKLLGSEKSGGRNVARFTAVMEHLLRSKLLGDAVRDGYMFVRDSGEVVDATLVEGDAAAREEMRA